MNRNYKVILNHDKTFFFTTLDGVLKFIKLLEEDTIEFRKKVDIQIYDVRKLEDE